MNVTLCIETTGPHCSVALAVDAQIYARDRLLQRTHNQHLLAMLDELFAAAGCAPADVDLVAFGCGPGSFTGVRIAAAAAQAVALAADAKVLPMASSNVLALSAARLQPVTRVWVCALPSRGQAYYLSAYQVSEGASLSPLHADELVEASPDWFGELLPQAANVGLAGAWPPWAPDAMRDTVLEGVQPAAADMIETVRRLHAAGASLGAEFALPAYVDGDSPWRKRNVDGVHV